MNTDAVQEIHSDIALELAVPGLGTGKCAWHCWRSSPARAIAVIEKSPKALRVTAEGAAQALGALESAKEIHGRIFRACGFDDQKYRLLCLAAGIDHGRPLTLRQVVRTHEIMQSVLGVALVK